MIRLATYATERADLFGCDHCMFGRFCDEDRRWPRSNGRAPRPLFALDPVYPGEAPVPSWTCAVPAIPVWWPWLRSTFVAWEAGKFLRAGGLGNQPAWWVRVMGVMGHDVARYRRAREKAAAGAAA